MSETRPEFGNGAMTLVSAAAGGLVGGIAGAFAGELAVIPILFPEEFAGQTERLQQIAELKSQRTQDQTALVQVRNIQSDAIDYTKLEHRVASKEARLETVESSHIPYDDIHTPALAATVGVALLLGAIVNAGRFRWQLYKEK